MANLLSSFASPLSLRGILVSPKSKRSLIYLFSLFIPFFISTSLGMDSKGLYVALVSLTSLLGIMAFFIQFPLGSRIKTVSLFANIDWSISKHKKVGEWLGFIFLLHPVFILAPRFLVSFEYGVISTVETVTSAQMLTGVLAWCLMLVWILTAVFKNKLPISYEIWRLTHVAGFVAIAILATLHLTTVGSHGQFQSEFNLVWWVLCTSSILMVCYNYFVKPIRLQKHAFTLTEVRKISSRDWLVSVESEDNTFHFEAGQFVWLNTSGSARGVNEHPFSIASCQQDLPKLSFIIRELGDYTSSLEKLNVGQRVFIDGPYGSVNLNESNQSKGITLVAGGAGIGPILSLLRELASREEKRPVRLIYGNQKLDQMVYQEEIKALEQTMANFKQQLVCLEETNNPDIRHGLIDKACLLQSIDLAHNDNWAVYMCGPSPMVRAVRQHAKMIKIPSDQVHYEQLAF